jgi:hypothetical protein
LQSFLHSYSWFFSFLFLFLFSIFPPGFRFLGSGGAANQTRPSLRNRKVTQGPGLDAAPGYDRHRGRASGIIIIGVMHYWFHYLHLTEN